MHRLPIVSTEREERQVGGVLHIAHLEVLETIAHGHRLLHIGAAHNDGLIPVATAGLPEVLRLGRMEHTVVASHLETLNHLIRCISMVVVLQVDEDGVTFYHHVFVRRTLIEHLLKPIVTVQGGISQTFAHLLLLCGVYLRCLVWIDQVVGAYQ